MNLMSLIKPFIFALIICYEYYQNDVNNSEHIFKKHNAVVTLSSRINRLLAECGTVSSTNPLSLRRQKEKEFDTESPQTKLEEYINEKDIANLENYIKENINNNSNIIIDGDNANNNDDDNDDDDDDDDEEEEGYSSNYLTHDKRNTLRDDYVPHKGSFLGFNKKKIKKYMTDTHMPSGFLGASTFIIGIPVNQGLNLSNKFAPAEVGNYVLTLTGFSYFLRFLYNVFFKTRKVNI
ncbi:hypothetical protein YYC_00023 [Plasmodium yoelii 17X]|uniref:Pv-fam-d protein n=1 Tax=Plasmodium yoelii 17X TaxID=1323249 RepID=V7PV55_PLAYE|nr:hypothetical protein YYC_00023 [Plasmodium yoelii 17X]